MADSGNTCEAPLWEPRRKPIRQWVLSFPYPLRFLFAGYPDLMGKVLGIVYRSLATHIIHKAGFTKSSAHTGAVTLI